MGKALRIEDLVKRKKLVQEALRDLSPSLREAAQRILDSQSNDVEAQLVKLLGSEGAKRLLGRVKRTS